MKFYILICYLGCHEYFEIFSSKFSANKKQKYLQKYIDKSNLESKELFDFEIREANPKNKDEMIFFINNLCSWDQFIENSD